MFFSPPKINKLAKFSLEFNSCVESEDECFIDIVEHYEEEKNTFIDYDNVTWSFYNKQMKYYDPDDKVWISPLVKKKYKPELL